MANINVPKIGTHNGTFHCDDALAVAMLQLLPRWSDARVVRTRAADTLAECAVVVDVGGVYDPDTHRYDHHQRTFSETMSTVLADRNKPWKVKLSSAGLVYAHFGIEVIREVTKEERADVIDALYDKVYENFLIEIDAIDNGISICPEGVEPQYGIHTNLSARVGRLNPKWNDEAAGGGSPEAEAAEQDRRFSLAMELVRREFIQCVLEYHKVWWPAREIVHRALVAASSLTPCGQVLRLEKSCPWKEHLFQVEKDAGVEGRTKFVLYADTTNDAWRVQAVPVKPSSFDSRLPLAEAWRGLRDADLCATANIPGCVFVHINGFIGGNKTEAGALRMALATIQLKDQPAGRDA